MVTHPYHTPACPEAKGTVGPVLAVVVTIAGIIGPLNIIPQILKIFETKSVANVSLLTYLIVMTIQVVWLVYAYKLSLRPLLISSIAVLVLSAIVVTQFFIYGGQLLTL
jgi:MtN3 and saliva related transmembrane protein